MATLAITASLAAAGIASAATYTVNDSADTALSGTMCQGSDDCTLRAAVQAADAAGTASTITVPSGSYQLTIASTGTDDPSTGDLDIDNSSSITVTGAGSGSTIVDAGGADRAFAVQSGAELRMSGLTIKNGDAAAASSGNQQGGAIYSDGTLAVTGDVAMADNQSSSGGAVFIDSGATSTSLNRVTLTGNAASGNGGAVDDTSPDGLVIAHSTMSGNNSTGGSGGAVSGGGAGTLTLSSSVLTDNQAAGNNGGDLDWEGSGLITSTNTDFTDGSAGEGGGIFLTASSLASFTGGSVSQDQSQDSGGGINMNSSAAFQNTTFSGDTSVNRGGAVEWEGNSDLTLTNVSLLDSSSNSGGGFYVSSYDPVGVLTNVTISGNTADNGSAYDAYYSGASVDLINDTITGNDGPGTALANTGSLTADSVGVVNTIIAGNSGGNCDGPLGDDAGNNIFDSSCVPTPASPGDQVGIDPLVGDPADNGGPVLTDRLLSGSPARAAANSAYCPATDARGITRASTCDVGAYEAAPAGLLLSTAGPGAVTPGGSFTITVNGFNTGPAPATGATVTDQLPAGATLQSASTSAGSCSATAATVTCDLGLVGVGSSPTVTLVLDAPATGSLANTATLTDDQGDAVSTSFVTGITPATTTGTGTGTTTTGTGTTTTGTGTTTETGTAVTVPGTTIDSGLVASPGGQVSIPLQCPATVAAACNANGTLAVSLPGGTLDADVEPRAASTGDSVVARFFGVQVEAGQQRLVAVSLDYQAVRYLRAHSIYRVRVTLTINNQLPTGHVTTTTQQTWLYVSALTGCHAAAGIVSAHGIGNLKLGMTRAQAHTTGHYTRVHGGFERFCIAGGTTRVAYPARALSRLGRARSGRVFIALTSNHHYKVRGISSGMTLAAAQKRMHLGRPIVVGKNAWYFLRAKRATLIIKAVHGRIREIGVTGRALTATHAQGRYLLHHL